MKECQANNYFLRNKQQMNKWNNRFIKLAEHISEWSKDPSTKVGAVVVDTRNRIVSVGYNGFAHGVDDCEERYIDRDLKYPLTLHSELNAILFAQRDLTDCSLYVYPIPPCTRCASVIIQTGIKNVYTIRPSDEIFSRWGVEIDLSETIFKEAGVNMEYLS